LPDDLTVEDDVLNAALQKVSEPGSHRIALFDGRDVRESGLGAAQLERGHIRLVSIGVVVVVAARHFLDADFASGAGPHQHR
jgi:hypothetical protein